MMTVYAVDFRSENIKVDLNPTARPLTAPPLLSTAPTRRVDRIAALSVVLISLLAFLIILPRAAMPSPRLVSFNLANDTGLTLIYMITGMLLAGQFIQLRALSLAVLASGYIFAALVTIAHLMTSAAIFQKNWPNAASPETAGAIFMLWHGIFPVFAIAYAVLSQAGRDRPIARKSIPSAIAIGAGVAIGLTIISTLAAVWLTAQRFGVTDAEFRQAMAMIAWIISVAALLIVYSQTRARRFLDMWLCVALSAWLLDILASELVGHGLYHFGWYAGRIYGILAAAVVLSALLLETGALYARLNQALADMQTQGAALSQSEAALRQAQKMEAIGQLTGGIAHDFNNLLTVIIGSLDMLRQAPDGNPRTVRLTDYAMQAAVRGETLTKQLLAFSRRQILNPVVIDPNRLIRDFDALMRRAIGAAVKIVLDLADDVGSTRIDPAQFEAALLNLAVNARDAMNNAGTITIRTRRIASAEIALDNPELPRGPYVLVTVGDTGIGMDSETLARVFEPFFTTKPTGKGSGLGLSQVYGFATGSHGAVTIESAPGSGTTVRLYLPEVAAEEEAVAQADPAQPIPLAKAGEIVLVVEDDPGVLNMAIETLDELGYGVLTAANGPEALQAIRSDARIDLLFSDIVMPEGMNGVELAQEAARIRPALKILLTSGYTAQALADTRTLPDGIEIIPKPYRLDELAQKLRAAIDG